MVLTTLRNNFRLVTRDQRPRAASPIRAAPTAVPAFTRRAWLHQRRRTWCTNSAPSVCCSTRSLPVRLANAWKSRIESESEDNTRIVTRIVWPLCRPLKAVLALKMVSGQLRPDVSTSISAQFAAETRPLPAPSRKRLEAHGASVHCLE